MHRHLRTVVLIAFGAILAACSGNSSTGLPSNPSNSASTSSATQLASPSYTIRDPETGTLAHIMLTKDVANSTPGHAAGVVPQAGLNMVWHGGPVQQTPHIYIVYWGWTSDPTGVFPRMQKFFNGVGGSQWLSSQAQYTDSTGHVGNQPNMLVKAWGDLTNKLPVVITQSALAAEAVRAVSHFAGSYSVSTNYIIATPHLHSQAGFGVQWCAYHSTTSSPSGTVSWTYMPYMTDAGSSCGEHSVNSGSGGVLDGVTIVGGHEQAETMTDPQLDAWYDNKGEETGDKCAWTGLQNTPFGAWGTFPTQPLWSNSANSCA
ncbi:MAG: hypothetical protein JO024_05240 [Candidatus Eremiobacteraeota bacterium]|nr:hypothetical protein [Candidatus Eremiobacteraeota bacterium]